MRTPVLPPEMEPNENEQFKLEVETGLSAVPDALRENEKLNSAVKIEGTLKKQVQSELTSVPDKNIAVYDVELMVSKDNGTTWEKANQSNFPDNGLTVAPDRGYVLEALTVTDDKGGEAEQMLMKFLEYK